VLGVRIVQMSDLHVGTSLFRPDLLSAAVAETNELAPDLVVIAGDLTGEGYRGEFEECRRFLDELSCPNVVVTMGNDDARNVGYRHFGDFFGARESATAIGIAEGRAKVVAIDSTKPDLDEGEVGREHYGWVDAELRGWNEGPRIVVIHHHILAVPGTGRDVNNLRDAGDFMAILRELEVDLVLSGHRHVPYVWSISGVRVVHSGTVSTLRVRARCRRPTTSSTSTPTRYASPCAGRGKEPRARNHSLASRARQSPRAGSIPSWNASCATHRRRLQHPRNTRLRRKNHAGIERVAKLAQLDTGNGSTFRADDVSAGLR
jgi:3',5'-cyclic-AMP phosphodiesterase